jgi:hypothetical protein
MSSVADVIKSCCFGREGVQCDRQVQRRHRAIPPGAADHNYSPLW